MKAPIQTAAQMEERRYATGLEFSESGQAMLAYLPEPQLTALLGQFSPIADDEDRRVATRFQSQLA